MEYKDNPNEDISGQIRIQDNFLLEKNEIFLPSIPIEEINKILLSELTNIYGDSTEILKNILRAQYYLNDPSVVYNNSYQSILRYMRNIVINPEKRFGKEIQHDAIFLIDKFMEQNDDSIHFICSLEMVDGFLTLFEDTSDEKLKIYLLRFFWLLSGHCERCNHHIIENILKHPEVLNQIDRCIQSIDQIDNKLKKYCLIFLKNVSKFELLDDNLVQMCSSHFLHIIRKYQDFPSSKYLAESISGLCLIIANNKNKEVWRPILQSELSVILPTFLTTDRNPQNIYSFLVLIYYWYLHHEVFEDLDPAFLVQFLDYKDDSSDPNCIDALTYVTSLVIDVFVERFKDAIPRLVEAHLLEIAIVRFKNTNYKNKMRIASFAYHIAKQGLITHKKMMVDFGYLEVFVEMIDMLDDEVSSQMLDAILCLFEATQESCYNCCIDKIQEIPGYQIIFDLATDGNENFQSCKIANIFIQKYFTDD